jgi:hypothetical protein
MASELAAALAKFQAALPRITANSAAQVPGGRTHRYADLAALSHRILPALGKVGLSFTCFPTLTGEGKFVLSYSLLHEGGEERTGMYPLAAGSPQQVGSALTYAKRYALCAVTGVAADEDDDGQAAEAAHHAQQQNGRVRNAHSDPDHVRLNQAPPEDYGRTQRTHGPVPPGDDRWAGQPAGEVNLPEDQAGSMDGKQQARMFALFAEVGLAGRDSEQRNWLGVTLGRAVESRKSLTWSDATTAIDALAEQAEREKLPGSADRGQVGAVASLYASKLGYKRTEKPQMLAASEQVIGRTLEGPDGERTHMNLSAAEARKLHDTLDGFPDRAGLEDWLKSPAEATP